MLISKKDYLKKLKIRYQLAESVEARMLVLLNLKVQDMVLLILSRNQAFVHFLDLRMKPLEGYKEKIVLKDNEIHYFQFNSTIL
jgi:hypothetical protein